MRYKRNSSNSAVSGDTSVYTNQTFLLWCNESRPIDSCEIKLDAWNTTFKLNETLRYDNYEYPAGAKFNRGECGIRIFKAFNNMSGSAICSVQPAGETTKTKSSVIIISVKVPPSNLQLATSNQNFQFKEGDRMNFKCFAEGGTPDKIELLIGACCEIFK